MLFGCSKKEEANAQYKKALLVEKEREMELLKVKDQISGIVAVLKQTLKGDEIDNLLKYERIIRADGKKKVLDGGKNDIQNFF